MIARKVDTPAPAIPAHIDAYLVARYAQPGAVTRAVAPDRERVALWLAKGAVYALVLVLAMLLVRGLLGAP